LLLKAALPRDFSAPKTADNRSQFTAVMNHLINRKTHVVVQKRITVIFAITLANLDRFKSLNIFSAVFGHELRQTPE